MTLIHNWHQKHLSDRSFSEVLADKVATGMGSWKFIIIQSVFVISWMSFNVVAIENQWDPYPFILLNLLFSTQAAYAAPIIMMSQNRAAERDRAQANFDHQMITALYAKLVEIDVQTNPKPELDTASK